jgi:hypothetical protein
MQPQPLDAHIASMGAPGVEEPDELGSLLVPGGREPFRGAGVIDQRWSPALTDFALRRHGAAPVEPPPASPWQSASWRFAADVAAGWFRLEGISAPPLTASRLGDRWWTETPGEVVWGDAEDERTEASLDLLDSVLGLDGAQHVLEVVEATLAEVEGRAATLARCVLAGSSLVPGALSVFSPGCDRYDVTIDPLSGVRLLVASVVDDQLIAETGCRLRPGAPLAPPAFPASWPEGVAVARVRDLPH